VDAIEKGRLSDGDLVLLTGFGAGMTWGSALIRWQENPTTDSKPSHVREANHA
jgi:hypothetical protein